MMLIGGPLDGTVTARRTDAIDDLVDRASNEVVIVVDEDLRLTAMSDRGAPLRTLFGMDFDDMVGRSILQTIHPDDLALARSRVEMIEHGLDTGGTDLRLGPPGGPYHHVHARGTKETTADGDLYYAFHLRNIDERKALEDERDYLAMHDQLTGLPNRSLFVDRLDQCLLRRDRVGASIAVAIINLDRFKLVNDGLGSAAGDHVLITVADRLSQAVRAEDTVARLSGDEFAVLAESFTDEQAALHYTERLSHAVGETITIDGTSTLNLTCSIGIAFSPRGDHGPRMMLQEADAAKSVVKARGGGGVELSTGGLSELAMQRLRLDQELRHAISAEELRVHYQPQVDRRTGRCIGVEALVRWDHPERGLVPPGEFIPVAEESDLIVAIGRFVLEHACRQVAAWRADGFDLKLSVNLAARQLLESDYCALVADVLGRTGLDADALTLEVTESVLFQDTVAVGAAIEGLRKLGVHLALDDFGTGYSSLVYLRRFEVGVIKIDQSFVRGIGHDPEDEIIIRGIVNLARSLGIDLVAEGAESEAEADWLVDVGCDVIQGYLYARPLPADELRRWLVTR